jgi:hypothetical protein
VNDGAPKTGGNPATPFLTADGAWLYFAWIGAEVFTGKNHLWRSRQTGGGWSEPEPVIELRHATDRTFWAEVRPVLSPDLRTIYYYASTFSAPTADDDGVWTATRSDPSGLFGSPHFLIGFDRLLPQWVSEDGCRLYVERSGFGRGCRIEVASRPP